MTAPARAKGPPPMTCILPSGLGRVLRTDRPAPPTTDQLTRLRYADWLRDHERGRPASLIAALYGVHPQSVRLGIRRARALRAEVARVAAG